VRGGPSGLLPARAGPAPGAPNLEHPLGSPTTTEVGERNRVEAILLVGGQGTRLRPLTISTPKPLLPTAGVPFLAHQLARAHAEGVERIVFATSYRASMFEAAFGARAHGVDLAYVTEDEPLGTGGAIRNAARALTCGPDDPVLILNGDVLSGHDVRGQVKLHEQAGGAGTLPPTAADAPAPSRCG